MQIIKEMMISDLSHNDEGPRLWGWKFPHMIDVDQYNEDRFECTEDRYPYSRIMYHEGLRSEQFKKAVKRIEQNDVEEVGQFRHIIIDEDGMIISGMRVLQLHKCAGRKSVEVVQILGLSLWQKLEMMMADADNFDQFNWTPNLPRLIHEKVEDYRLN